MSTVTPAFGSVRGLSTIRPPHPPPLGAELIGEAGLGDIGAHQDEFAIGRKWAMGVGVGLYPVAMVDRHHVALGTEK